MELSRIEYRRLVEDVAEAVLAKVLPFVKIGKAKACRVMFRKETLVEEHMRSQTERRRIPPARKNEATPTGAGN